MGVGDEVPPALEQLGLERRDARRRRSGVGRSVAVHDDHHGRACLRAARTICARTTAGCSSTCRNGGTLIVQYNKFEFNQAQYGPYPARVSSERVTDEYAPVEVLDSDSPCVSDPQPYRRQALERLGAGARIVFPGRATIHGTATSSRWRKRSPTTRVRSEALSSKRSTARAGGSTSASACGASCPAGVDGAYLLAGESGQPERERPAQTPVAGPIGAASGRAVRPTGPLCRSRQRARALKSLRALRGWF